MGSRQSNRFKLSASLAILILFVGLMEVILRVAGVDTFVENRFFVLNRALDYPDVFRKDREIFWRLKPNQEISSRFFEGHTFRINSLGLRGEEVDSVKTRPRILTLGNSCTFGWATPDRVIFPNLVGGRLRNRYEIINGSIPGYSSFQGRKFLASDLLSLEPDILLIMFGWNDQWAAASEIADKDQQFLSQTVIDLQNRLGQSQLYRLLKKIWLSSIEKHPDSTVNRAAPVPRVSLVDFRTNLEEICRLAKAAGAAPVLMTSPIPSLSQYYPRGMSSPIHRYHEQYNSITRSVARTEGVLLIDLVAEFDKLPDLWDDAAKDPIHFNSRGHSLAGLIIARDLRRAGLVTLSNTDGQK